MSAFVTRGGAAWMPVYLTEIDGATCIGCGRCYKVCSRDVMHLYGVDEDGVQRREDDDAVAAAFLHHLRAVATDQLGGVGAASLRVEDVGQRHVHLFVDERECGVVGREATPGSPTGGGRQIPGDQP